MFQFGFVVAQVFDHSCGSFHAVLYDEDETRLKNDGNYYFKNSKPAEPHIIIPDNRVTHKQYKVLEQYRHMFYQVIQDFEQQLQQPLSYIDPANMPPTGTYWTIYDDLYAISINKK